MAKFLACQTHLGSTNADFQTFNPRFQEENRRNSHHQFEAHLGKDRLEIISLTAANSQDLCLSIWNLNKHLNSEKTIIMEKIVC